MSLKNRLSLTETIKILIIFDRSFLTESIVVIRIIFPIRPKNINTNASIAPTNVACLVGDLT
jgi:hypothetical protein